MGGRGWIHSGRWHVNGYCEDDNEHLVTSNPGDFFCDTLKNYSLLNNGSAPWSQLPSYLKRLPQIKLQISFKHD
jgi:hypothetical protein